METILKPLLTVYEVSDMLQVHYNTVYELIRQKKLKAVKIGKSYRITHDFISEFIANSCKN